MIVFAAVSIVMAAVLIFGDTHHVKSSDSTEGTPYSREMDKKTEEIQEIFIVNKALKNSYQY